MGCGGLQRQSVFGMVGGRPELVAPLVGGSGSDCDLLQDLPVAVLAGVVDETEELVQVAVGQCPIQAFPAHRIDPPT